MKIRVTNLQVPLGTSSLAVTYEFTQPITAVFGASGAGKTAFLEVLAGVRRAVAGRIELDGWAVFDAAAGVHVPSRQRGLGYVPQDLALFPHRSVHDNLHYARPSRPASDSAFVEHVIGVLEIGALMHRMPARLSGGEKQRVALGRALLARPRLLLLDEPLASLDASLRERTLALLGRVHDEFGMPMLYVTHDPQEVVTLCHDVVVIESGRVVRHGPPEALFERTSTPVWQLRRQAVL